MVNQLVDLESPKNKDFIENNNDEKNVNNNSAILEGVTYGSDLRLFTNHADIPAVLFGPGDVRLAHSANEYIEIEEVLTCVKIIANLIIKWFR